MYFQIRYRKLKNRKGQRLMKTKDIALYIAIGLGGLAIISIFLPLNQGVLVGLSLSALLFTIAQTLESQLAYLDEDTQAAMEVANKSGMLNISEKTMLFFKTYLKYDTSDKRKERLQKADTVLNSVAFVILFAGFVVPLNVGAKISSAITVTSTGLLFLSLWFVEKQRRRKEQWNEVLMLSLMMQQPNDQSNETADETISW